MPVGRDPVLFVIRSGAGGEIPLREDVPANLAGGDHGDPQPHHHDNQNEKHLDYAPSPPDYAAALPLRITLPLL